MNFIDKIKRVREAERLRRALTELVEHHERQARILAGDREHAKQERSTVTNDGKIITGRKFSASSTTPQETDAERLDRIAGEALDAHLEEEEMYRRWERVVMVELMEGAP